MQPRAERRHERLIAPRSGYTMIALALIIFAAALYGLIALRGPSPAAVVGEALLLVVGAFILAGLYMLQPNEGAILTLFGQYVGTDRAEGLRWANPFYRKRHISLRARNLNAPTLKVNDKRGNPIEISAAVVWRVRDTAQAVFEVDDVEIYVKVQAEAALRHLASLYAYDEGEDLPAGETTLRAGLDDVAAALRRELNERFSEAGVEVQDAKLTHLAYAPEIAQVMLRRQQAEAIISARQKIVHGAVSMVEAALNGLSERNVVT